LASATEKAFGWADALFANVAALSGAGLISQIDHLIVAAPDLDEGMARAEELLGVEVAPGGQHPGFGTCNALVSLGKGRYLEIVGPDPDQPEPEGARLFGVDELEAPRLVTWVAKGRGLESLVRCAGGYASGLGSVQSGGRKQPDGTVLAWKVTDPFMPREGGVVPFFIDWGETPHPSATAPVGCELVDLRAEHPDVGRVRDILNGLGLDLQVEPGPTPALIATIRTPRGTVELR
jgi:hypothetical protein